MGSCGRRDVSFDISEYDGRSDDCFRRGVKVRCSVDCCRGDKEAGVKSVSGRQKTFSDGKTCDKL